MVSLVSPDYNFDTFCVRMIGKNPLEVIEAASAEATYARVLHSEATKDSNFRKGSKGRLYCDNLERLIRCFTGGEVPADATPEFLSAVRPLFLHLLTKWEIGNLRHVFKEMPLADAECVPELADTLVVAVSRRDVETSDVWPTLSVLRRLAESPKRAREFFERVDIAFHGYDHDRRELFEIPEVRQFVYRLDEQFPFWLYFLSKHHLGLQCLLLCFLPPYLTEEGRASIFPERIGQILSSRWLPAMNQMCEYVGLSDEANKQLTDRVLRYITDGPMRLQR
mgnify:CR=1 FL=1